MKVKLLKKLRRLVKIEKSVISSHVYGDRRVERIVYKIVYKRFSWKKLDWETYQSKNYSREYHANNKRRSVITELARSWFTS